LWGGNRASEKPIGFRPLIPETNCEFRHVTLVQRSANWILC
jgi:hypothetical protein